MPMTTPLVDVDTAQVSTAADGSVVVDDPASPWLVQVWVTRDEPRHAPRIRRLQVEVRDGSPIGVTASRLARLPVAQLLHVAMVRSGHPNEVYYRMLAKPRPPGARAWPDDHWARVLQVFEWAVSTGRPGGGWQAVADMWGVAKNPTAYRWVTEARRRLG